MLTKDSVTVSVDAVVYYRVSNATVSVANVENAHHSTRLLAQTTLRNILGTKDLHEILGDRETISGSMQAVCDRILICTKQTQKHPLALPLSFIQLNFAIHFFHPPHSSFIASSIWLLHLTLI